MLRGARRATPGCRAQHPPAQHPRPARRHPARPHSRRRQPMADLAYIALTIAFFALMVLVLKGTERR
ncbi:hypothetical protein GCM10018793_10030 [Streptomyces sulfonofaciens]|uniref:Uncharacterized protein n=1 Tax=Streptomyces sulfonofaciens TaxID=68272 RepID=A0A919KV07_9ACTN|nr:hypothetical protein [Streptomyces sulfonofaciens]GHH72656.1 hypothetical protein GCM10018793_10030 [Streptomyces sulfonofaciens]